MRNNPVDNLFITGFISIFIFSLSILLELLLIKRGNHYQLPHLLSEDDTELDVTGIDSPFTTMLFNSSVFV